MSHPSQHRALYELIGLYMVHWSSFELAISVAIWKISGKSATEVVRETTDWSVSRKVKHLCDLVESSAPSNKDDILKRLWRIPNDSIRNSIAHSYMRFGADRVVFLHRRSSSDIRELEYTTSEFHRHLSEMARLASAVSQDFGETETDVEAFYAAIRAP